MEKLYESRRIFRQYPMALYVTDVTFQPSFRTSGGVEERKKHLAENTGSTATRSKNRVFRMVGSLLQ